MSTRAFRLFLRTAQNRRMHQEGHTSLNCDMGKEKESLYEWVDEFSPDIFDHPNFVQDANEYHALVAVRVPETPVCPKCFNVAPIYTGIPGRVMGGVWVRGASITDCGECGYRISYRPNGS